jgi:hypothetical protein
MYHFTPAGAGLTGVKYNSGRNRLQDNPNKIKQNRLDFLGFIWPIWGFSIGYEQKNKKICLRLNSRAGLCANVSGAHSRLGARATLRSLIRTNMSVAHTSAFRHKIPLLSDFTHDQGAGASIVRRRRLVIERSRRQSGRDRPCSLGC